MPTQKKIDTVTTLTEKISRAKTLVFANYTGIKHKQLEELRRSLKASKGELVVAKNRLLIRSLGQQAKDLASALKDATLVLFAYEDEVAPLKALLKFFKNAGLGKTKGGLMGKNILFDTDVNRLASLPSKDVLLTKLAARLKGPLFGLHYGLSWNLNKLVWALNNIKNKKSN